MKKKNIPGKKIIFQAKSSFSKNQTIHKCCGSAVPTAIAGSKILDDLSKKLLQALWNNENTIGIEGQLIVAESLELIKGLKSG